MNNLSTPLAPKALISVMRNEWRWLLFGLILTFLLANYVMGGWSHLLFPDLSYPYVGVGDGKFVSFYIQRVLEGWVFDNPRSGYPFGSNFLDYPGSDSGTLAVFKAIGLFTKHYFVALNVYFIAGFLPTFVCSFLALRAIGLVPIGAFCAAILFNFMTFHFFKIGHLFYTWYFVIPVFFYLAFLLYFVIPKQHKPTGSLIIRLIAALALGLILGSFGVYYAAFGLLLIAMAAVGGWIRSQTLVSLWRGLVLASCIIAGIVCNLAPNLLHQYTHGKNHLAADRGPWASEIFGLKLTLLVLPHEGHRIRRFDQFKTMYNQTTPLTNSFMCETVGLIGTAGLILIGLFIVLSLCGVKLDPRLSLLSLLTLTLFLFGTIGGLGSLFAWFVTPMIRAWHRISIFIGFGCLTTFFLSLQLAFDKYYSSRKIGQEFAAFVIMLSLFGLWDQVPSYCDSCVLNSKQSFGMENRFVQQIEAILPSGAAVYQLPNVSFPEMPPVFALTDYELLSGFLNSKTLRWSYAGMKGRPGDLFYKALSAESTDKQLEVITRLGFAGIYIDKRGFADQGDALIAELTQRLGPPKLTRDDQNAVFFVLNANAVPLSPHLSDEDIMQRAGYHP